jgi:hypothetical protein
MKLFVNEIENIQEQITRIIKNQKVCMLNDVDSTSEQQQSYLMKIEN